MGLKGRECDGTLGNVSQNCRPDASSARLEKGSARPFGLLPLDASSASPKGAVVGVCAVYSRLPHLLGNTSCVEVVFLADAHRMLDVVQPRLHAQGHRVHLP